MNIKLKAGYRIYVMAFMFSCLVNVQVYAHDYSNLNEIMIDRSNESIVNSLFQIQSFLTDIFRKSYKAESWPDRKITLLRNDLMHQKEEANMNLDYFVASGINIQSVEVLFNNPLAGRSLAGNQGVETAYALLKHIDTLESQEAFVKEIYSSGQSAYMYNLVTAYREKMELYKSIFINVPGPGQQQITPEATSNNTVAEPVSILPYGIALALFSILVVGMLVRKRAREKPVRD
jgi:hypothetical protein